MFAFDDLLGVFRKVDNDDEEQTQSAVTDVNNRVPRRSNIKSSISSLRSNTKGLKPRIISRSGRSNTHLLRVPNKHLVYCRDFGNTLVNTHWRWILTTLCFTNFASVFIFGLLWMWMASVSGDFVDPDEKCIPNANTLTGYVLLSIETLTTIGYGYRYPSEKCLHGWIILALEALVGLAIQGAFISAVYVKITKPLRHFGQRFFSRNAVICLRDGDLCLIIRIIDAMEKLSTNTTLCMFFIDKEHEELQVEELKVQPFGFLLFPLEIVHVINKGSPFWQLTPEQILSKRMEIIVIAEGSSAVTGQMSQSRTSYVAKDIRWGHRFKPCVRYNEDMMKFVVDFKEANNTFPFDTPLCSAHELSAIAISHK